MKKQPDEEEKEERERIHIPEQVILISSLIAEADILMRILQFGAADKLYSKAIALQPNNLHLLMCRSKCRALNSDSLGSLDDANEILKLDPKNMTGLKCKADALFAEGDFENALVWYYRGQAARPDQEEFAHGIVRSQVAIERALKAFDIEKLKTQRKNVKAKTEFEKNVKVEEQKSLKCLDHNLLEELYEDYCFLNELHKDEVFGAANEGKVYGLVDEAVVFLRDRIEFWRARNPKAEHEITVLYPVYHSHGKGTKSPVPLEQKLGTKKHTVLPKIKQEIKA